MNCAIFCGGKIKDYKIYDKFIGEIDLIICADSGAFHARRLNLVPDFLIGDFDSIDKEDLKHFVESDAKILSFPPQKDETDSELAIDLAIKNGALKVYIFGALGSRFDHSLGNVYLLKKLLDNGIDGWIINENNEITLINNNITIKKDNFSKVSLLPFGGDVKGITTKGLIYSIDNYDLANFSTIGISNEFVLNEAEIRIKDGILMIIKAKD